MNLQQSLFKLTMLSNSKKAMVGLKAKENPLAKLWVGLSADQLLCSHISEWFKIVELAIVTLIGSIEDERNFSNMAWIKKK